MCQNPKHLQMITYIMLKKSLQTIISNLIRMFLKWIENIVEKGGITHCKQFFLFLTLFSKDLYYRQVKTRACLGKG